MKTIDIDFRRGQRHFLKGEYQKSIDDFSRALAHGFETSKTYLALGLSQLKEGHFSEAIKNFSTVLEIDSHEEEAYFLRGIAHLNNKDPQAAVNDLTESIRLNGRRGAAFVARGLALRWLGREEEAEHDLKSAISLAAVEVESFIREYAIDEGLHKRSLSLFDLDKKPWVRALSEYRGGFWH